MIPAVKVLIIPDKFKGTLTARQAGEAIAAGWSSVREEDHLEILPMSDGGEGFGEVIGGMMGAQEIKVNTVDAAHRPREASIWWDAKTQTAIIEAAQSNGLALLPPGKFHPFELDTFGVGELYKAAVAQGAKKIIVGIGGSATNDGGFGFARALGWRFFDKQDTEITTWTDLTRLHHFQRPDLRLLKTIVAVDVQNPLMGPNGASRIYGPQKGLREEDMNKAEKCLEELANVFVQEARTFFAQLAKSENSTATPPPWLGDFANIPGAGAAGGLGFGLAAFVLAIFTPGAEVFAKAAQLESRLQNINVVISGEGAIDEQSLMGKGVGAIFERCRKAGVRCIGLGGSLGPGVQASLANDRLLTLMGIVPTLAPLQAAKAEPARWLRSLAAEAAKKATMW